MSLFEDRISAALTDRGAPHYLASALFAIATEAHAPQEAVLRWIAEHQGPWSLVAFRYYCSRFACIEAKRRAGGGA